MMNYRRARIITFIFSISFLLMVSYTNCSRAPLEKELVIYPAVGKSSLCLRDYQPVSYYYRNLNLNFYGNKLAIDNDADGLTDEEEEKYGMDPFKRRSFGPLLDSVCLRAYGGDKALCQTTTCTAEEHQSKYLGLSKCDIKALSLSQNIPTNSRLSGWDTDLDSIPDFLEIVAGTNPLVASQLEDADSDGVPTATEIAKFTNPNYSGLNAEGIQSSLKSATAPPEAGCTDSYYEVNLGQGPVTVVSAYESVEFPELSHSTTENIYLVAIELSHKTAPNDPEYGRKVLYKLFKVEPYVNFKFNFSYKEADSVDPSAAIEVIGGIDP